jgi:glycosyltransferase involved in cell wall biosynthesis
MFVDELQRKHGHKKATLVMHTDPMDQEGTNLFQVIDTLSVKENVMFSKDRIGFNEMNLLYNSCDTIVNRSCNEGFGLPTLEMTMCGKPIIALKTGGLTRQVQDPDTGEQYGIGLDVEVRTMVGNHMVPYIYEDFVSHKTLADAFMKMYEMGPEGRESLGKKAMERARREYDINRVVEEWDKSLEKAISDYRTGATKRWKVTEI